MSHLLSLIPNQIMFENHSSANDRSCFKEQDGKVKIIILIKKE